MMSQLNEENSHKNSSSKYYISSLYTYDLTLKIIWDKNLPVIERQECKKYICKLNLGIFILKLFILEFSKKKHDIFLKEFKAVCLVSLAFYEASWLGLYHIFDL